MPLVGYFGSIIELNNALPLVRVWPYQPKMVKLDSLPGMPGTHIAATIGGKTIKVMSWNN
jgi:hypothetical protein